ncbi:MAG: hypothetical protein ACRD2B_15780 [Terriglobia bacterium]
MRDPWLQSSIRKLWILLLCPAFLTAAPVARSSPFCSDAGCRATHALFKNMCDFIVQKRSMYPTIYVGGYYMRDLVDGYEIFGDRQYLDTAIAYGDYLLKQQMPNGFWPSGYGWVALADTGSALGLFSALYSHVDQRRQAEYRHAVLRYLNSVEKDGMVLKNGAVGDGWAHVKNGRLTDPDYEPYTLSSALTGGNVFTWAYYLTKQNKYRDVAYHALKWILSTMRSDGNIPYISRTEGADWAKRGNGNPQNDYNLWQRMTYGTSAYVGEGVISFDLHCGNAAWRAWIQKAVRPNIEFLLRTQLPDGTWSKLGRTSWDRTRSPGIVNYLTWYYEHVQKDPRTVKAVRRWDAFVLNPQNGKAYGLLNDGATGGTKANAFNSATSLAGRALADIISPGVDARW